MASELAVIARGESALAFKAAGVDAYYAQGEDKIRELFKRLAKSYKVIFVTDDIAELLDDLIKRMLERPYPVIVPVPNENGKSEYAEKQIAEETERALGVDIFNK
mgnify:CR=1 FL=1